VIDLPLEHECPACGLPSAAPSPCARCLARMAAPLVDDRPKLLDAYGCAGGAGMGYHLAGFNVTGLDIAPSPNYPFEFIQRDALDALADAEFLAQFAAVHTSPPCQDKSVATLSQRMNGAEYPSLIGPTRDLLLANFEGPWVIENVPGAELRPDIRVCGCQFGLTLPGVGYLKRERWFETSWGAFVLEQPHHHVGHAISIAGHGTPAWMRAKTGHIGVAEWRKLMGIWWTTRDELTEAIPPAYTERLIGPLLLEQLRSEAA
jgi:DNA (cytosine-5)-methyltransferase 1